MMDRTNTIKSLKNWKFAGMAALIVLGFILHYLFSWTGSSKIIAVFVPVNESVWEHLKLGYGSLVLFSAAEYFATQNRGNNYYTAKLAGLLSLEATILLVFYSYTCLLGKTIFWIDIGSYVVGCILCQTLVHFLFQTRPLSKSLNKFSLAAFIAIGVLFGIATFYPPHVPIFMDKNNGTYGLETQ